jgi:hypothetical protein
MRLTKKEKQAFEFLKYFAECYLAGKAPHVNVTDFNNLNKINVSIDIINHRRVTEIKRGKDLPMTRTITNAPWYIRGCGTHEYLPFQLKSYKPKKYN